MEILGWQERLTRPASGKTCFPRSHIHVPSLAHRRQNPLIRTTSFPACRPSVSPVRHASSIWGGLCLWERRGRSYRPALIDRGSGRVECTTPGRGTIRQGPRGSSKEMAEYVKYTGATQSLCYLPSKSDFVLSQQEQISWSGQP